MPTAYYNEFDPYAAAWLRNLITAGHIAPGDVDERSITEVHPLDLLGYDQCHFFAGLGGWSYALRLAGWPDSRSVWTGSCPCQPFSAAGKQLAEKDPRHLWPDWFRLIDACRPVVVFGEQVASGPALGWLDLVSTDLEGAGYSVGAVDIPACGVGAPHIRNRLWFVAHAEHAERRSLLRGDGCDRPNGGREETHGESGTRGQVRGMADDTPGRGDDADRCGADGECVGDADNERLERRRDDAGKHPSQLAARPTSPWRDLEWLPCSDGKARPTQPGLFPLAYGIPGRVGRLRAYGNAIVPQVAAEVIAAFMACRP